METRDIGRLIEDETARRLDEMQSTDYEFPRRSSAWDWIGIGVMIAVSTILVALCMMGVIQ